ncbi:MAG: amidophosphoribosyltransferase [Chloroflexi bacterium]|nr:amidophosphoribosyltransferase [Chloroflexota bacterium]
MEGVVTDKPREACGVFGIYGPGEDAARITFFGLFALQHRGQESAGIVTGDGAQLHDHAEMGLVAQVFTEEDLAELPGHIAIGHTRYSTTGSSRVCNAQPIVVHGPHGPVALGHNGNLVNFETLRADLVREGHDFVSTTDSEIIARLIAFAEDEDWITRIRSVMARLTGAFSVVLATPEELFAFRDPLGVRPLCLGRLHDAWLISSESCALDTVGAEYVREIEPGEIVRITATGIQSDSLRIPHRQAMCIFEYIYFARPDSTINQRLVHQTRQEMGRQLAREQPADADIVIAVPDSATPAGIGYAEESGIPYAEGLVKNRYIGRTFIQPDQRLRERGVSLKYNPLPEVLADKRIVVVDDSIVRGTTTRPIVRLLRRAGAREVHVRIHAPPMMHPCYLGVDLARRSELIAARMTVPEICAHIEADTLGYLSLPGLIQAIRLDGGQLCNGCFTGRYPLKAINARADADKFVLERT